MAFYGGAKRVCVSIRHYCSNSASEKVNLIKQLRERTSAAMKDVKAALVDSNWDIEEAQKELRKRGKVLASKKSSRTASQGLLALAQSPTKLALIELNCETDFVARNDIFQHLALRLANQALSLSLDSSSSSSSSFHLGPQSLQDMPFNLDHPKFNGQTTVHNAITELAAMMGENVRLRRGYVIPASPNGFISTYLHTSPQPGLGRIAGILSLQVDDGQTQLQALQRVGSELAMHVVAAKPLFLTKELVPSDALENEREILKSQAEASGKPKMAIEKMVEGRLRKYFEDVVFMDQKFIMNDTMNVKAVLDNLSKEVGSSVRVVDFLRMEVGEGIARQETDTSETVAQVA
ncbi:Elongation factor Ts, mitochondrial [Glycine soja]|uniref:Elongation factor Ts, mitochondrial n=2 Tax=Glycine soja TaxID=3848 RepID=A0A0B2QEJ0_GLYSO|nr:elongation factor Ts, mitochondrial [Glycine soja]XP_028218782.1 elongation factor Ts, mitochondrial [Glycine soja]KHN19700.1 Elongation factor Ts, mitochondrial [Glycine soja]RZB45778.1 Elongation factor Ts, mitochondrial isoform A [Glycine soja]RZB45780.1 Elongation factor Ts, mitochondrial isoform C [Glycine soja]